MRMTDSKPGVGIEALVRRWDERVRADVSRFSHLAPQAARRRSVLHEAAREADVVAAEQRLGVRFPPSYRAFLLISNGADASSIGAESSRQNDVPRHGFLPVQMVGWARDADPHLVQLWTSFETLNTGPDSRGESEPWAVTNYQRLSDGLLISRPFDVWRDVLVPRPGEAEWEFWVFVKEGAYAHSSFARALEAALERQSPLPDPKLVDIYLAEAELGELRALEPLAELGHPRTGELARERLRDAALDEMSRRTAVHVLSLLADPEFLPDLRAAYAEAKDPSFRIALLVALKTCGDPALRELLERAAHDGPESVRRWAAHQLGEGRTA